jgi:hypothetical protein
MGNVSRIAFSSGRMVKDYGQRRDSLRGDAGAGV